jgi:hypothetical protein
MFTLQRHLAGRPLYERLSVHLDDINRIYLRLPAKSYDVILLNLVLSSMPKVPDFTRLSALLAPGGLFIVADINPAYTNAHPYYRATAADGTLVAMHTHPVQPLEVATRAKEARLQLAEMTKIGSDEISYSFIVMFVKPDVAPLRIACAYASGAGRRGHRGTWARTTADVLASCSRWQAGPVRVTAGARRHARLRSSRASARQARSNVARCRLSLLPCARVPGSSTPVIRISASGNRPA